MMKFSLVAGLILSLTTAASNAQAAAFTFSSNGQFTGPVSGATIVNNGNQVDWPNQFSDHSYMAANDFTSTGNPGSHIEIGAIDWYNSSQSNTSPTVSFGYQLTLNFTSPAPKGSATNTINLTVTNTPDNARVCIFDIFCSNTGPVNDTAGTFTLPSFTVDGFLLSNITFAIDGSRDPATFAKGIWSNPENHLSQLDIYADISPVPEPASLMLLGTALAGIGVSRRRARLAD